VISVVIATHNRRHLLERTLDALAAQDMAPGAFEVVVVDNGSSDGTSTLLHRRRERDAWLHPLLERQPGKSFAVNTGIAAARGDLLAFTDDDVIPAPGWLTAFAQAMNDRGADFAVGRISPLWEVPPPRWISRSLYGVLAVPDNGPDRLDIRAGVNEHVMAIGANMAIRREVCLALGGWRTDLGKLADSLRSGEDHEFFLRMLRSGLRGVYEPTAHVRHLVPASRLRKSYFRRWLYDNGAVVSDIESVYHTGVKQLGRVPRYLWREALADVRGEISGFVRRDEARRFAAEVRLLWFAGYLRRAWTRRSPRPAPALSLESK
jgi:glycosyltransferase involved in cell wall biosynthesis